MKKYYVVIAVMAIVASVMITSCGGTKPLALPSTSATSAYKVGDPYNKDGVRGIVVKVTEDGKHGLVMSLEASGEKWGTNKNHKFATEAFHEDDGAKNMEVITKFINDGKGTWKDFPLFDWARSLGEGWYIPANDELLDISSALNGGTVNYDVNAVLRFNKIIAGYGGKSLFDDKGFAPTKSFYFIFSSTEANDGLVYKMWPNTDSFGKAVKAQMSGTTNGVQNNKGLKLQVAPNYKNFALTHASRAVHKF